MFRFILSFLTGFGTVYFLLKKDDENINNKNYSNNPSLKFPSEPQEFKNSEKFMKIIREFNKVKRDI